MCPVQRAAGCEAKDDMTEVMRSAFEELGSIRE